MGKIKELKEKRASIYGSIDELRKETDGRSMTAEERAKWDKLTKEHADISDDIKREEQFQDIEARQAEQAAKVKEQKDPEKEYRSAFRSYLLGGRDGLSAEERALLEKREGLSGLGRGSIVPTSMADSIEVALKSYGGMFEAGEIITTSGGGDLFLPTVDNTNSKAQIVAEYGQTTKGAPTFSAKKLGAYTYRTNLIPVSVELLQDTAYDISSVLTQLLADQFGRGANEHLTVGTGTGQPSGLITGATKGADAAESAITFDNVLELMKSVDPAYAKNGKFMFNNDVLYALMSLKDNNGQYIWQMSARDGASPKIFGKDYVLNSDMSGIGTGNTSMVFGDLKKYKIRVVKGFTVLRLNELLAEYLSIGIFGFGRLDGILLDAGTHPVKTLKHAGTTPAEPSEIE